MKSGVYDFFTAFSLSSFSERKFTLTFLTCNVAEKNKTDVIKIIIEIILLGYSTEHSTMITPDAYTNFGAYNFTKYDDKMEH